MAAPWEKYAQPKPTPAASEKPWEKYAEAPPAETPSMLSQFGRAAAMGGRYVVQGAADLISTPSDALFAIPNVIQSMRGKPEPFKLARTSIAEGLTAAGLPEAQTGPERFAAGVESALGGSGAAVGIGNMLATRAAPAIAGALQTTQAPATTTAPMALINAGPRQPMPQSIAELLASHPGAQAAGAVTGTSAQTLAAAMGAPVPVQIAAGAIGGAVGGGIAPTGAMIGRGTRALATPITEAGRRAIAGRVLNTAASDAKTAGRNLAGASELVAGSAPTTGQAAKDVGLAYFEQRLRGLGDARFNNRTSDQNSARQALIDSVADGGTPEAILKRVTRRDQVTAPLRDRAFAEAAGKPVAVEKVLADIDAQLANPENAGKSVQDALKGIRTQIEGKTDARALYAVRKEINRILEGRYVGADESVLRYAGGQLGAVKGSIDAAITEVAPSWGQYLTKYAQLSKPIERVETMQDIRSRTSIAAPDIRTGREMLSQAKWKTTVDRAMPDLEKTLTKGQLVKLRRITNDLDRGAAAIAAGKVAGSDTAANLATGGQLSVAYVLGQALGKGPQPLPPGLGTATRPLSWIYKLPDEEIRSLLVDAMLDPKLAEQLMREGTLDNLRSFSAALKASSAAGTVGAATQAGQTPAGP